MKRLFSILLVLTLVFSACASTTQAATADQPSSWAVEQVKAAVELGLVPSNLRSLYQTATTRAEFCALAVALYEGRLGEITKRVTFTDCPATR